MDEYDGLRKKNPIKKGEKTTIEAKKSSTHLLSFSLTTHFPLSSVLPPYPW